MPQNWYPCRRHFSTYVPRTQASWRQIRSIKIYFWHKKFCILISHSVFRERIGLILASLTSNGEIQNTFRAKDTSKGCTIDWWLDKQHQECTATFQCNLSVPQYFVMFQNNILTVQPQTSKKQIFMFKSCEINCVDRNRICTHLLLRNFSAFVFGVLKFT